MVCFGPLDDSSRTASRPQLRHRGQERKDTVQRQIVIATELTPTDSEGRRACVCQVCFRAAALPHVKCVAMVRGEDTVL